MWSDVVILGLSGHMWSGMVMVTLGPSGNMWSPQVHLVTCGQLWSPWVHLATCGQEQSTQVHQVTCGLVWSPHVHLVTCGQVWSPQVDLATSGLVWSHVVRCGHPMLIRSPVVTPCLSGHMWLGVVTVLLVTLWSGVGTLGSSSHMWSHVVNPGPCVQVWWSWVHEVRNEKEKHFEYYFLNLPCQRNICWSAIAKFGLCVMENAFTSFQERLRNQLVSYK